MERSALLFVPHVITCCLNTLHTFVRALWSSPEQENFTLSARDLSLPVTHAKASQTLGTGRLPVTPDVLCFQQTANSSRARRQPHVPAAEEGNPAPASLPGKQNLQNLLK